SYYPFDLSNTEGIDSLIENITSNYVGGGGNYLVYSAGIAYLRPLSSLKPEILAQTFRVNHFSFIETVRQLTRKGRYAPGMRIVGISSVAALAGDGGQTAYGGSKAAMTASVRVMAKELSSKGIAINTIAPAMTRTNLMEQYIAHVGDDVYSGRLMERQYLGAVEPQAVANLVAFLLSPAARFITGTCIPIDSGYMSQGF
ncbi:MAG: SDR family oxidoreductase, partial [Synergistaceae bacterium]|nr:SDR family oxidoreductase [Synergistaceae bacterium]